MGFGHVFCRWVNLFYCVVCSAVNVNGYLSRSFFLFRGVRQGGPLSPLLYVLVVEILASNVRAHPSIPGIVLPGSSSPLPVISAYADDTSLVLSTNLAISAVLDVYRLYENGSGAKLNLSKCEGLWLGSWSDRSDCPVAISWSSTMIKVLGIFLGPGDLAETNWRPRITAVMNGLNSWHQRSLSYGGRALVVNALALSRVWYVGSLSHVPRWVISELNSLIFNFFWAGRRDLVARKVVVQLPCLGGFSMIDVQSKVHALHVQWVRRFLCSPSSWVSFLIFWFRSCFSASTSTVFSSPSRFIPSSLPPFYAALLDAWYDWHGSFYPHAGIGLGIAFQPVSSLSTKAAYLYLLSELASSPHCVEKFLPSFVPLYWHAYLYLLSELASSPHCVEKFLPSFVPLYWHATWRQLRFFPLDRPVIDLSWMVAHGVLYTIE